MFHRITRLCRERLVQNALALYGVTFANALLPLVLIPYVARVLGPGPWGTVLFAQTAAIWLGLLVEYGFTYSATREVARHADEPEKVRQIVTEVMAGRLGLCLLAVVFALALWWSVPEFRAGGHILMVGTCWLGLAQGLSPLWYFQGRERMRLPAVLEVACRVLYVVAVFIWVRSPADAPMVLVYQAAALSCSLLITLGIMYRQTGAGLGTLSGAWRSLREAWSFFLFAALVNVYTRANSFFLGLLASPAAVSFYGGPERMMRGILSLTGPVNQVLYPRLAWLVKHDLPAARTTVRQGTLLVAVVGTGLGLVLTLGAAWWVAWLLGPGYDAAVPVLRVLGLVCPFAAVNSVMGIRWMFPLGLDRTYNRIVMAGAALNVGLVFLLVPAFQAAGAAWAVLTAEGFIAFAVFILLWRRGLNPFQRTQLPEAQVTS